MPLPGSTRLPRELKLQSPRMTPEGTKLYRAEEGVLIGHEESLVTIEEDSWDSLVTRDDLAEHLASLIRSTRTLPHKSVAELRLRPPIGCQEVWAAGVTYFRSRNARAYLARYVWRIDRNVRTGTDQAPRPFARTDEPA